MNFLGFFNVMKETLGNLSFKIPPTKANYLNLSNKDYFKEQMINAGFVDGNVT